ncbi:hypothetical protein JB92DRAFT_3208970 [Gautieria morchelliformis]|nr:hypothetical protein JB92DRAFT_3208970 [Gautieria morchelliformis]
MTARAFDIFQRPDKPGFLVGANALDLSSIGIALGLLYASIVADAHDRVHNEVQAQSGFQLDRIQQDGSFSQHQGLFSNDVWELEIEAGGMRFAATGPSRTAFENLMNVSQWMIYQNTLQGRRLPNGHVSMQHAAGGSAQRHISSAATKRKALQEINLTQLPTCSTVLKKTSTQEDSSSRTRPRLGPAPTETLTTNPSSCSRLTEKGLEYQIQVEADKQRLARQRERRLTREEEARALDAEVAALRDEGLGDEEIAEFLSDLNANDSEDEPGPQTCPGRIQANEFAFKATMAVVTAASKPSVSNAVRRQTASSPVPLRSVTCDAAQPHRPSASSPGPRPDNGHMDRTHGEQGLGPGASPQRLHDHGGAHAGFPNIATNPRKPAFNAAKVARAAQALDDDEHSDS